MSDAFYAWYQGKGDGCDYTIGCNQRISRLVAASIPAAIEEACGDEWSEYDDERIERITILRVTEEHDCVPHIASLRAERDSKEKQASVAAKRAQLERLKRELGEA